MRLATLAAWGVIALAATGPALHAQGAAAPADKKLLAQLLVGDANRAALIAKLSDKELRDKATALLPEIARATTARAATLALEAAVKEADGKIVCESSAPKWLVQALGGEKAELFDVPVTIDLYNGNNPLKGKGERNEKVTDEWLKRLAGAKSLRRLDLANCAVKGDGLRHVGTISGLRELNLTLTPVTDEGLKHLAGLTELRMLGLASTKCDGTGFAHLTGLKKLESVNFHFTPLNDAGLRAISKVPISGRLWFAHTRFTDEGAASLSAQTQLKRCGIGSTEKGSTGEAVAALAKLPLEDLALLDNQATPAGVAHAAKIATLRKLDVSHGPTVKDDSMALVAKLPLLEEFKLGSAQVTDDGLKLLAASKSLKKLSLSGVKAVTPAGIEALRKACPGLTVEAK